MKAQELPMNIELLILDDERAKLMKPIETLEIYDGVSKNFHPKGLFSTEIFGRVGDPRREAVFSYINLNVEVYHPFIYKTIIKLKALYGDIMSGKAYAIFDPKLKDFVRSNQVEGQTGYNFFFSNFNKIELLRNKSIKRDYYVELIDKYKGRYAIDKLLVLPAGLRDLEVDSTNRVSENEINKPYRKVLGYSNLIQGINTELNMDYIDNIRYNMQVTILEIYTTIKNMLEGKRGMIQDKWASRKIFNSTRNVITGYVSNATNLDDPRTITTNHTVVGLYQCLKCISPLSLKLIRDEYLSDIFTGSNSSYTLINKDTLQREHINSDPRIYDEWMTSTGIEKKLNLYSNESSRHLPITIGDKYLLLILLTPDNGFKVVKDIRDVPEELLKVSILRPITYTELYMASIYKHIHDIPVMITRYPAIEYGSIYPSWIYLKSTVRSEVRYELDDSFTKTENVCAEFPIANEKFFESTSVSVKQLARLGADFDGDRL